MNRGSSKYLLLGMAFVLSSALALSAAEPDAFSPVVSYQYLDSLDEPGASIEAFSPVISYQYFDWPGDDVVQFTPSLSISYFFNVSLQPNDVTLHGHVYYSSGAPLPGATISIGVLNNVITTTTSDLDGGYSLPPLPAGIYLLTSQKTGFGSEKRALKLWAESEEQSFLLKPSSPLPVTVVTSEKPKISVTPITDVEGSSLKVYNGNAFSPDTSKINRSKMTIVLTHGWTCFEGSGIDSWPTRFAASLRANGISPDIANVVGWDWYDAAHQCVPIPEDKTPRQGWALGKTLYQLLGSDYHQPIHFIGHSLGTLVNAQAANYLHGHRSGREEIAPVPWDSNRTHMTLFDEAEMARIAGKDVLMAIGKGILLGDESLALRTIAVALKGWKSPIPNSALWIDNYVTLVGLYHSEAVNACLEKAIPLSPSVPAAHSYAQDRWYAHTIQQPEASLMGFKNSFERHFPNFQTFPPPISELVPGDAYHQSRDSGDEWQLEQIPFSRIYECFVPIVGVTADITISETAGAVRTFGTTLLTKGEETLLDLGNQIDGLVLSTEAKASDLLNRTLLKLRLTTKGPEGLRAAAAGGQNSEAFLWVPLSLPPTAIAVAFEYSISGDPREDAVVFGTGEKVLLQFDAKFVPSDQVSSTSLIDVSSFAGTTTEFFFGIAGGTSTNCAVQIESIRFFSLESPRLSITSSPAGLLLSWPTTAVGYGVETSPLIEDVPWTTISAPQTIFGGQYSLQITPPTETQFFRLRHI
jgi:pimeloyl-ACP methyl ester carboxylesterase